MTEDTDVILRRCAEFSREFQSSTDAGSVPGERIYGQTVAIDLHAFGGAIWLSSIRTFERGRDHASVALNWLCGLADRHRVAIIGEAKPYNTALIDDVQLAGLDATQLAAWYERHGFKVNALYMRREPRLEASGCDW